MFNQKTKALKNQNNLLARQSQELKNEITALKSQLSPYTEKENAFISMEELKDIDFAELLSVAVDHNKHEWDILKLMTTGVKRVVGNQVEVTLFQMRTLDHGTHKKIVDHEKISIADLVSQEKALYCLIDTELGDNLNDLEPIDRYLTLRKNTVLGDTELYGEGIVSQKNMRSSEGVKYFRYDNYNPYRFMYQVKRNTRRDKFRVSFPIYHIEEDRIDEIEYILLVRNIGDVPFTNHQIRAIRGYGNYGTLSLSIKQLIEKDREILKKDKQIEQQNEWIVTCIRRYLHDIATPLSTIENIIGYLNEIMDSEADTAMAKKYLVLLSQINKVKHSLQSIRETISETKYYQQTQDRSVCFEVKNNTVCSVELDLFIREYLDTVDINESYGNKIHFDLHLNAGGASVLLDKTRMSFILDNVTRNTYQQIESKGVTSTTFEIKTIYDKYNKIIVLFLKDSAGGLSEEQFTHYLNNERIITTKHNGTGEGIPAILDYFREMGCKNVELKNFLNQGLLYTASFPVI